MSQKESKRNVALWVSILYFAEGFPYTVVNSMSVIFLKGMGASNELIGLTSFLYLPWVLKGLWGPIVDLFSTKRQWILNTEIICTILLMILSLGAAAPQAITLSILLFAVIAFVSATHDIAIDGFYLNVLNKDLQALYVGVRNTAYRGAMIAGGGGLVFLAGYLEKRLTQSLTPPHSTLTSGVSFTLFHSSFILSPLQVGWTVAFALSSIIFLLIYLFQQWYLPHPLRTAEKAQDSISKMDFIDAFKSYFTQNKMGWVVAYIVLFRLGDAFTFKMAPSFLMDKVDAGGLTISTEEMGILYGTVGIIFLLIGGLVGGYLIAKQGLKKWIWPMTILQNSTNLLYWLLAIYRPGLTWAYVVNSFEQLTYGLGVAAYTVFLMRTIRPEYQASHYAITTGFMAAGVLVPGIFSGYLQKALGYPNYFLMSSLAVIPGMITIFFLPSEKMTEPTLEPAISDSPIQRKD